MPAFAAADAPLDLRLWRPNDFRRSPPIFQEPVPALECSLSHLRGVGGTFASRRQASKQQLVRVAFDIGCLEVAISLQHCNQADIQASARDRDPRPFLELIRLTRFLKLPCVTESL